MEINGKTYYDSGEKYSFKAKLGQDIASLWPTQDNIDDVIENNWWGRTTWHFKGWQSSDWQSTYVTKRLVLSKEMLPRSGTEISVNGNWIDSGQRRIVEYWLEDANGVYQKSEEYSQSYYSDDAVTEKEIYGYVYSHSEYDQSTRKFYYDRTSSDIIFNYGSELIRTINDVKFGFDISSYNKYEPDKPANLDSEYIFDGWYDNAALQGEPYEFTTMPGNDLSLYAKWVAPQKKVKLHYNYNDYIEEQDVTKGEVAEIDTNIERPGYDFEGWYTDPDYTVEYDYNAPVTTDIDLYAKWTPKTTTQYTVRYVVKENGEYKDIIDSVTKDGKVGKTVSENAKTPDPDGEYSDYIVDAYTKTLVLDADSSNNEIVFEYSPIASLSYIVQYKYGTEVIKVGPIKASASSFRIVPDTEIVKKIQKLGYEVQEGFIQADLVSNNTKNVFTFNFIPGTYTIKYIGVDGAIWGDSNSENNPNPVKYSYNDEEISITNPKKAGYIFDGWDINADVESGTHDKQNVVISKGSRGNLVLTANWKAIDKSSIVGYYANAEDEGNNTNYYHQGQVYLNVFLDGNPVQSDGVLKYGYEKHNCVDVKVTLHKDYVLNGVYAIQSHGSNGYQQINVEGNVVHVDNVADQSTVYVYLTTKYTVKYVLDPANIATAPVDTTIYTTPSKGSFNESYSKFEPDLTSYGTQITVQTIPEVTGYNATGWKTENEETIAAGDTISDFSKYSGKDTELTFTANFTERTDLRYEVHYFYDGTENKAQADINENATFGADIPYTAEAETEVDGKHYVIERIEKTGNGTVTTDPDKNIVNIYYLLDEDGEDGEQDGTPDKYQIRIKYAAGANGTVDGDTEEFHTVYTFDRADDGTISNVKESPATPIAKVSPNPVDGYAFVNWTSGDESYANTDEIKSLSIMKDTTFTANFTRDFSTITVSPYEGEYDGQEHNVTVNGTIKGDKVEYSLDGGQTYELGIAFGVADVTLRNNGVYNVTVRVTNGGVSDEYESTIKITPRPITITTGSATKTYDGTPLTNSEIEITKGSLVNESDLEYRTNGTITDAGTADNSILTIGTIEMQTNYDITVEEGTLTVTPRPITLTSGSASKNYDGTALTNSEVTITSGSLVNAGDVTYAAVGTITNVGSSLNRISVSYASEQMARNYVVTLVEGTLTVNTAPTTPTTPPTTPTTPPTTPGTPGTTTDDGATTDEPEVEEVEDEETPLSDGDVEDVEDNATPKGNNGIWALINLIAAIVTVILGLILLLSKRHRNDEEEDEEERQARIERGEEKEQEQKRGWICKVLGVIVAIVSVVFFILTEDMSLPMALTDKWTIWMIVIAIVELVLVLVGRHWKDVDDEDQEQQA